MIIIIILNLIISNRNITNSHDDISTSPNQLFNVYANYFLYGDESAQAIAYDGNQNDTFFNKTINLMLAPGEWDENFLAKNQANFQTFYDAYIGSVAEAEIDATTEIINAYRQKLSLVTNYYSGAFLTVDDILETYSTNGEAATENMINDVLSPYAELGEIFNLNYYTLARSWSMNNLTIIVAYQAAGCIRDTDFDYACIDGIAMNDETKAIAQQIYDDNYYMQVVLNGCKEDLYEDIFFLNYLLNNPEGLDE